jgi:hypothetical protein
MNPKAWKVMNLIFFGTLTAGWCFGYVVGDKVISSGVAGVIFALCAFFIGATTAMMKSWFDHKRMVNHYEHSLTKVKQEMDDAVEKQRVLCAEAMINISKASVGRVVDRVLSEHPVLATNAEQLEAAKEDARIIVEQELEALEDAVAYESRQ